jgi:hypothetical protein
MVELAAEQRLALRLTPDTVGGDEEPAYLGPVSAATEVEASATPAALVRALVLPMLEDRPALHAALSEALRQAMIEGAPDAGEIAASLGA